MPFTSFHLIPGTSVKSVVPQYFSFSTLALTNILIDSELLYYLFTTGIPSHKLFDTLLGVTLIAIFVGMFCKPICEFGLRVWNKTLKMEKFNWFRTDLKIAKFAAWSGALIGAFSQLILDSIIHRDMSPFFPFSDYNGLQRIISVGTLHDLCAGLFGLGILIFVLRKLVIRT